MGAPKYPDYDGEERMGGKVPQDLKMGRRTTSTTSAPDSQSYATGGLHVARSEGKPFGGKVKPKDISGFARGGGVEGVQPKAERVAEGEGHARGGPTGSDAKVQPAAELEAEGEIDSPREGGLQFHGGTHHHYHTGRKRGGPVGREHHDMGGATGPAVPAPMPQAAAAPPDPKAVAAMRAMLAIKRRQAMAQQPTPAAPAPAPAGRPMMSRGGEKC